MELELPHHLLFYGLKRLDQFFFPCARFSCTFPFRLFWKQFYSTTYRLFPDDSKKRFIWSYFLSLRILIFFSPFNFFIAAIIRLNWLYFLCLQKQKKETERIRWIIFRAFFFLPAHFSHHLYWWLPLVSACLPACCYFVFVLNSIFLSHSRFVFVFISILCAASTNSRCQYFSQVAHVTHSTGQFWIFFWLSHCEMWSTYVYVSSGRLCDGFRTCELIYAATLLSAHCKLHMKCVDQRWCDTFSHYSNTYIKSSYTRLCQVPTIISTFVQSCVQFWCCCYHFFFVLLLLLFSLFRLHAIRVAHVQQMCVFACLLFFFRRSVAHLVDCIKTSKISQSIFFTRLRQLAVCMCVHFLLFFFALSLPFQLIPFICEKKNIYVENSLKMWTTTNTYIWMYPYCIWKKKKWEREREG